MEVDKLGHVQWGLEEGETTVNKTFGQIKINCKELFFYPTGLFLNWETISNFILKFLCCFVFVFSIIFLQFLF